MKSIPEFSTDIFSHDAVRNANAIDDQLREFAPVVKLPGEDVVMLARFEQVSAGLKDWRTYSSTSRPGHDPNSVRPELLLTDDPPKHTGVRAVVSAALSPVALNKMAEDFRRDVQPRKHARRLDDERPVAAYVCRHGRFSRDITPPEIFGECATDNLHHSRISQK